MLKFSSSQCVEINNKEEFDKIYPYLRSASKGVSLAEYVENGYPEFPLYLEYISSVVSGTSIGFTYSPCPFFQILKFNDAFAL